MDNDVQLKQTANGVLLVVQAQPRAKRNGVTGVHNGALKVAVTQAPEKGKANDALIQVLAKALNLRKSQIQLVGGATSTQKKFLLAGADYELLQERISALS